MSKLKFADVFTLVTGIITFLYSLFMIGKMVTHMPFTTTEFQLLCAFMLVNAVNVIHSSK